MSWLSIALLAVAAGVLLAAVVRFQRAYLRDRRASM